MTGVAWKKDLKKWRVSVWYKGKNHHGGLFDSERVAARAYDAKAKELYFNPVTNFRPDGTLNPDRKKFVSRDALIPRREEDAEDSDSESGSEDSSGQEEEEEDEESGSSSDGGSGGGGSKQRASRFRGTQLGVERRGWHDEYPYGR